MVLTEIKANRLYWLGRYEERVYLTLHLLRRAFDTIIDGSPDQYLHFWKKFDLSDSYSSTGEFMLGMMYDEQNPSSLISSLNRVMDNAIMLREEITSETDSYIEMSLAMLRRCSKESENNITNLQPLTDWALAFWGSLLNRVDNPLVLAIIMAGLKVECIDIMLRFDYPIERIAKQYASLKRWIIDYQELIDETVADEIETILMPQNHSQFDEQCRIRLNHCINRLVKL